MAVVAVVTLGKSDARLSSTFVARAIARDGLHDLFESMQRAAPDSTICQNLVQRSTALNAALSATTPSASASPAAAQDSARRISSVEQTEAANLQRIEWLMDLFWSTSSECEEKSRIPLECTCPVANSRSRGLFPHTHHL